MSFLPHTDCRACGDTNLDPVFDLGLQPPANDFQEAAHRHQGFYPLKVLMCHKCSLAQLSVVVDPHILYDNYLYTTSTSQTMQRHFARLFCDLRSECDGKTMVEIGSNNGALLEYAQGLGFAVLGIDPAANLAAQAEAKGIRTLARFFDGDSADCALGMMGVNPAIILARHCFAHVNDWKGFVAALERLAGKDTLIAIEVPYVQNLLAKAEFDTVYFEHLSYVSLTAVAHLLRDTNLRIHRVQHYGIHGGAVLIMLRRKDSGITPHLSADEYLSEDQVTVRHWERFHDAARAKITAMRNTVNTLVRDGKRVCGFGASAKASVWINACGFTRKELLFVSDNSPLKPGRFIPGTDIPIISEELLLSEHPDVAVCFAWNFKSEILESQKKWRDRGGRFIFPTPEGVEIV